MRSHQSEHHPHHGSPFKRADRSSNRCSREPIRRPEQCHGAASVDCVDEPPAGRHDGAITDHEVLEATLRVRPAQRWKLEVPASWSEPLRAGVLLTSSDSDGLPPFPWWAGPPCEGLDTPLLVDGTGGRRADAWHMQELRETIRRIDATRDGKRQDLAGRAESAFAQAPAGLQRRIEADPFLGPWLFRVRRYVDVLEAGPYDYFITITPCRRVADAVFAKRFNALIRKLNGRLYLDGYRGFGGRLTGYVAAERLSNADHYNLHFHLLVQQAVTYREPYSSDEVLRSIVTAAEEVAFVYKEPPMFDAGSVDVQAVDDSRPLVSYITKELTERQSGPADLLYELGPGGIQWQP